jgi:hypothetical protein
MDLKELGWSTCRQREHCSSLSPSPTVRNGNQNNFHVSTFCRAWIISQSEDQFINFLSVKMIDLTCVFNESISRREII